MPLYLQDMKHLKPEIYSQNLQYYQQRKNLFAFIPRRCIKKEGSSSAATNECPA